MAMVSDQTDISARTMTTLLPSHVIDSHMPTMLKLASMPSMAIYVSSLLLLVPGYSFRRKLTVRL